MCVCVCAVMIHDFNVAECRPRVKVSRTLITKFALVLLVSHSVVEIRGYGCLIFLVAGLNELGKPGWQNKSGTMTLRARRSVEIQSFAMDTVSGAIEAKEIMIIDK